MLNISSKTLSRISREHKELCHNPPPGISGGPVADNLFHWNTIIAGPLNSPYEDGLFVGELTFPHVYPLRPPSFRFVSEMYHPNIYVDGRVSVSILEHGGGVGEQTWSPVLSTEKILLSIASLLSDPDLEAPVNIQAADLFVNDPRAFNNRVRRTVEKSLALN